MTELSSEMQLALRACGWSEEYRYDLTEYESKVRAAGDALPAPVRAFLTRFGGLEITVGDDNDSYINTNITQFSLPAYANRLMKDDAPVKLPLLAIGTSHYDLMALLMDADGAVYRHMVASSQNCSGYDLHRIALSGVEALNKLAVECHKGPHIAGEWVAHWE